MTKIQTCKSHEPGDIVKLGGTDFVVLDNYPDRDASEEEALFILAVNSQGHSKFGDTNNYAKSDLRDAVCDWLDELDVDPDSIYPREIDMMTLDGYKGYGTLNVKAAPLTLDEARKYAELIPKCDEAFWLSTGWAGPDHYGSASAVGVRSNGSWSSGSCSSTCAVRPALVVPSYLLSSDEGTDLSEVPTEDLLEELARRTCISPVTTRPEKSEEEY